jgi:tetratricopeptide (TPR) repeat protein
MISWVAMDRIVEKQRAADPEYRKNAAGKVLRSDAKWLTDGELLTRLRSFGIDVARSSLGQLCRASLSAQEIAQPLLDERTFNGKQEQMESDWIWICLTALWQRWFPDQPCFEILDDKIQLGYELRPSEATVASRVWLEAWDDVLRIFDRSGMQSIREFDLRFEGTQSLFNWIQDLEDELWRAGRWDRRFLKARIAVCKEALRRFHDDDRLSTENRRRALAESLFELGETEEAEGLYCEWLNQNPRWGWGWIGWSDCYRFTHTEFRDWARSEQLLREGLAVAAVGNRTDILDRLADLCKEQGRTEEAHEFRQQSKNSTAAAETWLIDGSASAATVAAMPRANSAPSSVGARKIGRNDPCLCGSGKKYKKCCGA